jgi:hypothetical protein
VKESTSVVILSGAEDLHSFVFNVMQMLRCAQHDRPRFFHTFSSLGAIESLGQIADIRTNGADTYTVAATVTDMTVTHAVFAPSTPRVYGSRLIATGELPAPGGDGR